MRRACATLLLALALPLHAQKPLLPDPASLPPTQSTLVFGQKIVFYDLGHGPTVVLVHGFASQAFFDWGNVLLPLAQHHRVIALDQIGFGASSKPLIDYSIQTFVDFLAEFLRAEHIDRFTLAGESLGGWIAASYTIQALAPTNTGPFALPVPTRLILEDAAGHTTLAANVPSPVAGSLADAAGVRVVFFDKSRVTEAFIRENFVRKLQANDGFTQRSFRTNPAVAHELVTNRLATITIPTLVVWGANDELVPLADGRDFAARIPGAQLTIVPQCGHAPSLERPEQFLAAVEPFLETTSPQATGKK